MSSPRRMYSPPRSPRPCYGSNISPHQYSKPSLHQIPYDNLSMAKSSALDSTTHVNCTKLSPDGIPPSARNGHSVVQYQNLMLIFGGEGDLAINHDLFSLVLEADEEHNYVWNKLQPEGIHPPARHGHSAVLYGDSMFIFGGGGLLQPLNDVWEYNIPENKWRHRDTKGERPGPRKYHSAAISNTEMFIYGGDESALGTNRPGPVEPDVYAWNLETGVWRRIHQALDPQSGGWVPRPLTRHSTVFVNEAMYMFGGLVAITRMMELQAIRVTQKGNVAIERLSYTGRPPSTRSDHSACVLGNSMYVFGGEGDSTRWGDLYELNLETMTWRAMVITGDLPPETSGHSAVVCKDQMFIFGGIGGERFVTSQRQSDVYKFDLSLMAKMAQARQSDY